MYTICIVVSILHAFCILIYVKRYFFIYFCFHLLLFISLFVYLTDIHRYIADRQTYRHTYIQPYVHMNTFICFFSYLFTRTVDLATTVENTISIIRLFVCREPFAMLAFRCLLSPLFITVIVIITILISPTFPRCRNIRRCVLKKVDVKI